jgi:hypothetical protein
VTGMLVSDEAVAFEEAKPAEQASA